MSTVTGTIFSVKSKSQPWGQQLGIAAKSSASNVKFWFDAMKAKNVPDALQKGDIITVTFEEFTPSDDKKMNFLKKVGTVTVRGPGGPARNAAPTDAEAARGVANPVDEEAVEEAMILDEIDGPTSEELEDRQVDNPAPDLSAPEKAKVQLGGCVHFKPGVEREAVETILQALGAVIESADVREFVMEEGSPVFYIP